jgi:TonB family protein
VERLKAIDYWLPQGQEQAFAALVRPHLRPQPGGPTNLRLRVQPGSTPMLQVGRSELCPPESRTQFRLTAPATAQLQKPQPVRARIHVDAQGQAQSIQVLSSSGDRELDRWVTEILQRHTFSPGLIDGTPVAMDYEETVQISARP